MIPSVADIRAQGGGLSDYSDFEILQAAYPEYQRYYPDFNGFAKAAGVDVGSLAGNRLSAGVDNYQANLYGLGEAVAGAVGAEGAAGWLGERRVANETQARGAQQFAQTQGAVDDWRDVSGVGSGLNYLGGLAAQSAPYLGEAIGGAIVGGATLPATLGRMGLSAGRAVSTARTLGAVGASYPSAVGDILQNQRDEAGVTDLGSAMIGGVPYAAANAFGMEGVVARGLRPIANVEAGLARRMGVNAGLGALGEGASETFQEGVNQYFGRMAVNPDQTMFNEDANKRYIDSFVGGAALGGVTGGVSGIRKPRVEDQPNLLDRGGEYMPPQGGSLFGELEVPPQFSPVNGPIAEPQDIGAKYAELSAALGRIESGMAQAEQSGDQKLFYELSSLRNQLAAELTPLGDQVTRQEAMGAGSQMGLFSQGEPVTRGVQPPAQPDFMQADMFGNVAATQDDIDRQNDPGAVLARQMWADRQNSPAAPVGTTGKGAGVTQPTQADPDADLKALIADRTGLKPNKKGNYPASVMASAKMIVGAELDEQSDTAAWNALATNKHGQVKKVVNEANAQPSVQPVAANAAVVGAQSPVAQATPAGVQTSARRVTKDGTVVGPANTGAVAGIDPNKTVTVGRKGREKSVTPQKMIEMLSEANVQEKQIILAAAGYDLDVDPTTLAPVVVSRPEGPIRQADIAKTLGVSRQAVNNALAKFGLSDEKVDAIAGDNPTTYSEAEVGIEGEGGLEAAGMRVESSASKATGSGLVDGEAETKAQRENRQKADELLKAAGPSTAVGVADDVAPTNLPPGTVVTDLREGNAAQVNANILAILSHEEAVPAAGDWDSSVVQWKDLPPTLQADWVAAYVQNLKRNGGDLNFQELTREQSAIEDDYTKLSRQQAPTRAEKIGNAGAGSSTPVVGRAESQGPAVRAESSTSGNGKKTLSLKNKKADVTDAVESTSRKLKNSGPSWARTTAATVPGEYSGPASVVTDLDAFADAHPGARAALDALETAGLGEVFGEFDSVYIAHDSKAFDARGSVYFDPSSGTLQLWLDEAILNDAGQLQFTIQHEVGHVIDGAFGPVGMSVYSGTTHMAMSPSGNPSGVVARALKAEHNAQSKFGGVLDYPFNEKMSAPRKQEELFAQMFATALMGDKAAGFQKLPKVAQEFITKVVTHAQINADRTISRARTAAEASGHTTRRPNAQADTQRGSGAQATTYDGQAASRVGQPVGESTRRNLKSVTLTKPAYMNKAPSELWEISKMVAGAAQDWTSTRVAFTHDLLEAAGKSMSAARDYAARMRKAAVEKVKLERAVSEILDRYAALPAHLRGTGETGVNAFLMKSTMERKWGFVPDWIPNFNTSSLDADMVRRFNAMPKEARDIIKDVFRHGDTTLKEMQKAALESIRSEVDPLIAQAKAEGNTEAVKELERQKVQLDGKFQRLFQMRSSFPYAPLRRYGSWAVVAKSKALVDAESRNATAEVDKLKADGNHYVVKFVDGRIRAELLKREVEKLEGDWGDVAAFERTDDTLLYGGDSMFKAFSRFRNLAKGEAETAEGKVSSALNNALASMYMQLISETSARTAEINRKSVLGADADMMKAFATQGRASAAFIGSLKTSGDVMDSLREFGRQANSMHPERATRVMMYNEVLRRHAMGLDYAPNETLDKALAANSYWSLITSPSYILTNLTQPWVASLPYIAGRFGFGRSFAEMRRAYGDVVKLAAELVKSPEAVSKLPDDVRAAVQELFDRGSIDISLAQDLGTFESGTSDLNAKLLKIVRAPRTAAERAEMVNRVATAVATYRLATTGAKPMGHDAAVNYTQEVITRTHGDYTAFNAPRFMRTGAGRLMTQFRKFQLIQLSLYAKMVKDSLPSNMNADERAVARRALAYSLGAMFSLGGLAALPGYMAISFVLGAVFGDDDEPDDVNAAIRRAVGDSSLGLLLTKGAPAMLGLDVANRIGAGGMLSVLPYTDLELSRDGYKDIMLGVAGPLLGGTAPKMLDGLGMIRNGELWKGLEALAPRGVADFSKALRFGTEGITKRNGDVVLSGEEIGLWAATAQAFGLPTTSITETQMLRNTQFKADEFYRDRTTDLKRDYVEAYRSNDVEKMGKIRTKWMETQDARRALGYPVQPLSTLLKSPQEQRKREAKPLNKELIQ